LAPSRLRPLARARAAFSLSDCDFEFVASLLEIAALVERAAEIAVSLSVISVTDFKSRLKLANRVLELSASVEHQAEIVMRIGGGIALRDCLLQRAGSAIQIAKPRKRVPKIAMRIREVALLLFDCRLVGAHRFGDLASRVKRIAEIVEGFGVAPAALLDRGPVRLDCFIDFAEVIERDPEVVPGGREAVLEAGGRAAKTRGGFFEFASFVQRETQIMMSDRIIRAVADR